MIICLLKSKIHRAAVTGASVDYEGSLTIAADLAERVGLRPYEKILVGNLELNGATAHLGKLGDRLTIMSFAWLDEKESQRHKPAVIVLDEQNTIVK